MSNCVSAVSFFLPYLEFLAITEVFRFGENRGGGGGIYNTLYHI